MAIDSFIISLPALIALTIKGGLFWYSLSQSNESMASRLFLYFLAALTVVNVVEISGFYILIDLETVPVLNGYLYYVFEITALSILFHLVTAMSLQAVPLRLVKLVYSYAGMLVLLLLTTDWVVADFQRYAYAIVRVPGPLYFLFEWYALPIFLSVIGMLYYGSRKQRTAVLRLKNRWMLIAIVPMCLVIGGVVSLLHLGVKLPFNTNVLSPIAVSYFLLVSAYAIHQYRLFDLQFFLPWSKVRRRQTAFYDRIRSLISEIADLRSPDKIVGQLAQAFTCPVALLSSGKTITSDEGAAKTMGNLPRSSLNSLKQIVVTDEIRDTEPQLFASLDERGIAAVVPFNSYAEESEGWLLLGRFSDQIYSRKDFDVAERLFAKLADEFLEQQLASRNRVSNLKRSLDRAMQREERLQAELDELKQVQQQQFEQLKALQEQLPVAGATVKAAVDTTDLAPRIVFFGKQKTLQTRLKKNFPQTQAYFSPASNAFRSAPLPEVVVCDIDDLSARGAEELLQLITEKQSSLGLLLAGQGAAEFLAQHRRHLSGALIERLPDDAADKYMQARVFALTGLVRAIGAIIDSSYPVIAGSPAGQQLLARCRQSLMAGQVLCLVSNDTSEGLHLARYMALEAGAGELQHRLAHDLLAAEEPNRTTDEVQTPISITGLETLDPEQRTRLGGICLQWQAPVVLVTQDRSNCILPGVQASIQQLPPLSKRSEDLPYLAQYFALQYNLATGGENHLSNAGMDRLLDSASIESIGQLQALVFAELEDMPTDASAAAPATVTQPDDFISSLDNYLAEKEIELLKLALEKCGGNKAKTAAMLDVKPNTLHYKLKRYGLLNYPYDI